MQLEYRNARLNALGTIDLEYLHPVYGWIWFTASPTDAEEIGRKLHALALSKGVASFDPKKG